MSSSRGPGGRARVRVAFLDRDGTINERPAEGEYVTSWSQFRFLPRALDAIVLLNERGFEVIVVTNQRGIALGRMGEQDLVEIHRRMVAEAASAGGRIDAVYSCPHDHGECSCRKPDVGLFVRARERWPDLRFSDCAVIGDSDTDIEAARRLGCVNVLIDSGGHPDGADHVAGSLWEAVGWLVSPADLAAR